MELLRKAFKKQLDPKVSTFVASVKDDEALIAQDIEGSLGHVAMLIATGLVEPARGEKLKAGLIALRQDLLAGKFKLNPAYEDVHMNVEKKLEDIIGEDALRLHTARSRNDQVALDLRLFVLNKIKKIDLSLQELQSKLLDVAITNADVIMPGYTHLQRAQPVLFAHAMHAFFELFNRDRERFIQAFDRASVSPLGAGALAGSALPIDPAISANELQMSTVFANSIDAVSDRDFVADFLFAASLTAVHLSQMSETLIIWCTQEFGFVQFDDSVTTSSSLMPQKKNPDPLEIIRGKAGTAIGELVNLLVTLKGLPLGYNRDLQETKPPAIRVAQTVIDSLEVMSIVVSEMQVDKSRCQSAASDPDLFATDLVEYLVLKGVPFRKAHDCVSQLIAHARSTDAALNSLALEEYKKFAPEFDHETLKLFDPDTSVANKRSHGSTGIAKVKAALAAARDSLTN